MKDLSAAEHERLGRAAQAVVSKNGSFAVDGRPAAADAAPGAVLMAERVLIVDDNPTNLKLVAYLVTRERLRGRYRRRRRLPRSPRSRRIARALILMDLQLPASMGSSSRAGSRPTRDARHRIIAVTAYAMKGDEEKALEAGCDDYVTKPIDTRALPGIIARHIGGRRLSHKIMVVDDNSATRRMVRIALVRRPRGHRGGRRAHARELMARSARGRAPGPDAPRRRRLRARRPAARAAGTDVPILAFSGFVSKLDEARASSVGFDDIITKPIAPRGSCRDRAHLPSSAARGALRQGRKSWSRTTIRCS